MKASSLLKQERINRGWSRAYIEARTERRIAPSSLERWEEGKSRPREYNISELCKLYGKTSMQLGLDKSGDIIGVGNNNVPNSQNSQGENPTMSDLIRRSAISDLGSYLTGLVSTWPRRNHHYGELQEGINKAVTQYNRVAGQDDISAMNRRQALMSLGLVPIQLMGGFELVKAGKPKKAADTDTLLTHCAAGLAAGWYLRRGKDLNFVNDLTSSYTSILQPLVSTHSESHRQAAATLLAQNFRLKGSITNVLKNSEQAIPYYHEAIRYGLMAKNSREQAIANRMIALSYWEQGTQGYEQALSYSQTAYELMSKDTPRIVRSFAASGLSLCQAVNGHTEDAEINLSEARNSFDGTAPASSLLYTESNLLAIRATVHLHSGRWQESIDLYKESIAVPDISVIGSIQARIQLAKAEVSREDTTRDMALCVALLTEAITRAKELDSKRYIREARECYDLLRIVWPREDAVKKLGKQF